MWRRMGRGCGCWAADVNMRLYQMCKVVVPLFYSGWMGHPEDDKGRSNVIASAKNIESLPVSSPAFSGPQRKTDDDRQGQRERRKETETVARDKMRFQRRTERYAES